MYEAASSKLLHPLTASLGGLGLFFLPLDTRFVVKPAFLDLREKALLGQFLLKILNGLFNLIILNDNLHIVLSFPIMSSFSKNLKNKKSIPRSLEMLFPVFSKGLLVRNQGISASCPHDPGVHLYGLSVGPVALPAAQGA
jgi:hypothetical protein